MNFFYHWKTDQLFLLSGSAVTLSSGAPGSAQATSSSSSGNDATSMQFDHGFGLSAIATIVGLIAGLMLV